MPNQLSILWFIPCITIVYGTSIGPQNYIGNYLGPYIRVGWRAFCITQDPQRTAVLWMFGRQGLGLRV